MKKQLFFLTLLLTTTNLSFSQNRAVARGAEPGELYLSGHWYGIYHGSSYFYDSLQMATYRLTENGKKLTIQYNADYFGDPTEMMIPQYIIADATSGAIYNRQTYSKNSYSHTALWVSLDYGKNWIFREENIGIHNYYTANIESVIYMYGQIGYYKSMDYGQNFYLTDEIISYEPGLQEGEAFSISNNSPYQGQLFHTYDFSNTYTLTPIDSQFVFGSISGIFPDVYRGGLPGEVYVSSLFPDPNYKATFKASFSADTGYTFRHVFVSESHDLAENISLLFMSDREPGVFYIIRRYDVEEFNPHEHHLKVCVEYYRDYGETLEAVFCHDITKNYEYEEVLCDNTTCLDSKQINQNSIQLQWSSSNDCSFIRGYHVYRNNERITNELLTDTTCLDENLPVGNYEYYVRTYYKEGCVSDSSNHIIEIIDVDCEAVSDLYSEKCSADCVLLTWSIPESLLEVKGYRVFRNDELLNEKLLIDATYFDENLPNGVYEYYVITHYVNNCISDISNRVEETIELGIKEFGDGIVIFPNPTTGELRVTSYELQIAGIEIFDVYGRAIITHYSLLTTHYSINISHLSAGLYFVKITTEKGVVTKKIVKH